MIDLIVVNLKARLQPMHRHDLEDAFLEACQEKKVPLDVVGGGTAVSDNGEPLECDIEIEATNGAITQEHIDFVVDFFHQVLAPKGSNIKLYGDAEDEPKVIEIGRLEGLSLVINGTDLSDEVYKNCDINHVVEQCELLMEDMGRLHSYCETQHTNLYFYGESFERMKQVILPFINNYPLCEKSQILQIA